MQVQNKTTMLLFAFISSRIVKRIKQKNRNNKISLQTTRNLTIIKKEMACSIGMFDFIMFKFPS